MHSQGEDCSRLLIWSAVLIAYLWSIKVYDQPLYRYPRLLRHSWYPMGSKPGIRQIKLWDYWITLHQGGYLVAVVVDSADGVSSRYSNPLQLTLATWAVTINLTTKSSPYYCLLGLRVCCVCVSVVIMVDKLGNDEKISLKIFAHSIFTVVYLLLLIYTTGPSIYFESSIVIVGRYIEYLNS